MPLFNCYFNTRGNYNPIVLESIKKQTASFELNIITSVFNSKNKYDNIAKSKEMCREIAEKSEYDFIIIHEEDCVELDLNNFQNMLNFMIEHKSYGAVALRRLPVKTTNHVCCGVVMFRKEILKDKNIFRPSGKHICYHLIDYFKSKNLDYGYLNNQRNIIDIDRLRNIDETILKQIESYKLS